MRFQPCSPRSLMMKPLPLLQIALIAGAMVAGICLDRLLLSKGVAARQPTSRADLARKHAVAGSPSTSSNATADAALNEKEAGNGSRDDSRKSLEAILAVRGPRERTRDLVAFIGSLRAGQFADALKRVHQMSNSNERELATRLLAAQWVQSDPDGALQFAAGNRGFEYLADDVFQQQAAADFESALTRARQIPGNDLRYRALRGVLRFKAETDPAGAILLAQTLGEIRGSEPLANALYRQWAASEPAAAAAHAARGIQGEGWRSPVLQVVNTWAQQDPVAAANWSLSLPDGEPRARALSQVMREWGRDDPTSTANWIYTLPVGPQRDTAVAGLAYAMVSVDAQTALGWIGTMSDEATKQRTLQRVSREVMWREPANGSAMLQAAGLPADRIAPARGDRGRGP
jgi:hypothetical protein